MNYKEYKQQLKEELETYKEKIKAKLDEFKEKQNLKLEKFKLKTNKNEKKTKRKYKGGLLATNQTNALTTFITSISNKDISDINLDDIRNNNDLKEIFTPDYFIQEFDHIADTVSMMETKAEINNKFSLLEKLVTLVIKVNLINDYDLHIFNKLFSLIKDYEKKLNEDDKKED